MGYASRSFDGRFRPGRIDAKLFDAEPSGVV